MIKLDEKDIKAVGRARFVRSTNKQFNIILISGLVLLLILGIYLGDLESPLRHLFLIPTFGILGYMIWYIRNMNKAEQYFVSQWKNEKLIDGLNGH